MALAFSIEGRLGLNITRFSTKLNEAQKNMNTTRARFKRATRGMKKSFKSVTKSINSMKTSVIALGASAAVLGLMTKGALNAATAISDMARQTGTSVERIQELTIAFSQFGLEGDDVSDVLNTLADRSKDAIDGMQSFIDDFRLVGIEVDDLKGKDPAGLFDVFADAIKNTADPVARSAALVRILGDDLGRKLGPALLEGAKSFKELATQAHAAGVIMDASIVKGATDANRRLLKLATTVKVGVIKAFSQLAPFIDIATKKLETFLTQGSDIQNTIIPALRKTAKVIGFVADVINGLNVVLAGANVAWQGFKLAAIGAIDFIIKNINFFATAISRGLLLPLQGMLEIAALFNDDAKAALGEIKNFKIELPDIDSSTLQAALKDVLKAKKDFNAALMAPIPSVGLNALLDEMELALAKTKELVNEAEKVRVAASGAASGVGSSFADSQKQLLEFGNTIRSTLGSELQNLLTGNFDSIGSVFKSMLTRMVADAIAADIAGALGLSGGAAGGNTGGNFIAGAASFFGGFFANGGRPPIGRPSIVGERGPEVFVPDSAGTIIPNNALGGTQITNNITITTRDPETFRSARGRIAAQLNSAMRA